MNQFNSKVVDVTRKNDDGSDRQSLIKKYCEPGKHLLLQPEPDNPLDPDTFGVLIETRSFFRKKLSQIGNLDHRTAVAIWEKLRTHIGLHISAEITDVTGGSNGKNYGVNILIHVD